MSTLVAAALPRGSVGTPSSPRPSIFRTSQAVSSSTTTGNPSRPQAHSFQDTEYQRKQRQLFDALNALQAAGAQCADLEIPCIVVCGNQSAGKSSLIERITGIPLPRAKGTCTKCPMEVRLSTSGSAWQCKVKLNSTYDAMNQPLSSTQERLLCTVDNKQQLSKYISAAQRALLNPSRPLVSPEPSEGTASQSTGSLTDTDFDCADISENPPLFDELKFTRNKVVLEVSGADVDLSLIDLPGIIQTDADGDNSMVELVHNLVKDSISNDRAIIVTAITCKDDMENQQVVRMARAADPTGIRTIGVLTKPDTIEESDHEPWVRVLSNERFALRLGYYCVRNPNPRELENNMSLEDAAEAEHAFFSNEPVFSAAPAAVQERYGVHALREALSRELVGLAQRELPKLKMYVDQLLTKVSGEMHQLPLAPSKDRLAQLMQLLSALSWKLDRAITGQGTDMRFYNAADKHLSKMADGIYSCRPATWLNPKAPAPDTTACSSDPGFWIRPGDGTEEAITVERAKKLNDEYQGSQLPTFAPYKVLDVLVHSSKGKWEVPIFDCLQQIGEDLTTQIDELLEQLLGRFPRALTCIRNLLEDIYTKSIARTEHCLSRLLEMENTLIHTRNKLQFVQSKKSFMEMLVKHLCCQDAPVIVDATRNTLLTMLSGTGIDLPNEGINELQAAAILSKQGLTEELFRMIAGALAYYQLSSARIVDNVDSHIKHMLLHGYQRSVAELPAKIVAALAGFSSFAEGGDESSCMVWPDNTDAQVVTPDMTCMLGLSPEELMAEDSHVEAKRQHLQGQLDRLRGVRRILANF